MLQKLVDNPALQGPAIRGLAAYDDPQTPAVLLAKYPSLNPAERHDALHTLASRIAFAKPLMAAVGQGAVPVKDLSADVVRQLRSLKDAELEAQILKVWGVLRDSSADMKAAIAKYKRIYQAGGSVPGDASRGRAVFARTCQQCHTLFGTGGKVGPDLTGSNRGDLDYILLNVIDPNAIIPNDYRASNLDTKDGRSITGIVTKQDDKSVTVVTPNEVLVIPRGDIESLKQSALSMMPEGLLQSLNDQEVRDLIYYLSRPGQVPLPKNATEPAPIKTSASAPTPVATPVAATPTPAGDVANGTFTAPVPQGPTADGTLLLFHGNDLSGWEGDMSLWRVENGEIVGQTPTGLKHNEFLKSKLVLDNFRLVLKVKLTPNKENSGVQFRSQKLGEYEMKGPQADIGLGWWGKLYEENGRAILSDKPGDPYVNQDGWNTYEILAVDGKGKDSVKWPSLRGC